MPCFIHLNLQSNILFVCMHTKKKKKKNTLMTRRIQMDSLIFFVLFLLLLIYLFFFLSFFGAMIFVRSFFAVVIQIDGCFILWKSCNFSSCPNNNNKNQLDSIRQRYTSIHMYQHQYTRINTFIEYAAKSFNTQQREKLRTGSMLYSNPIFTTSTILHGE